MFPLQARGMHGEHLISHAFQVAKLKTDETDEIRKD
jgi:hypothetical protein